MEPTKDPKKKEMTRTPSIPRTLGHLLLCCWMAGTVLYCTDPVSSPPAPAAGIPPPPIRDSLPVPDPCRPDSGLLEGNYFHSHPYGTVVLVREYRDGDEAGTAAHRLLSVLDDEACRPVLEMPLPALSGPDFPYFLAQVNYNHVVGKLAVRGTDRFFVVDLAARSLSGPFFPPVPADWAAADAADGNLTRLEVWEQYLVGWMGSSGSFVADLTTGGTPTYLPPLATYRLDDRYPADLFLLPSYPDGNRYHAVLTGFDPVSGSPTLSVLFEQPRRLVPQLPAGARNNRFLVLSSGSGSGAPPVAIDMAVGESVALPDSVARLPTQALLRWLRTRAGS